MGTIVTGLLQSKTFYGLLLLAAQQAPTIIAHPYDPASWTAVLGLVLGVVGRITANGPLTQPKAPDAPKA